MVEYRHAYGNCRHLHRRVLDFPGWLQHHWLALGKCKLLDVSSGFTFNNFYFTGCSGYAGGNTYIGSINVEKHNINSLCGLFYPHTWFREEFGFRGYLLPRIWWMGARKALIVGAIIYWAWHWPVWLIPFVSTSMTNAGQLNLNMVIQMLPTILFGALLTGCTAIILSYVWMRSGSIVVSSVFHGYFDGLRNITMFYLLVNASALSNIYYVAFIIILTLLLLWRGRWVLPEPLELRVLKVNKK